MVRIVILLWIIKIIWEVNLINDAEESKSCEKTLNKIVKSAVVEVFVEWSDKSSITGESKRSNSISLSEEAD